MLRQIVTFVTMWVVGIVLNPMNFLAFEWSDLYLSKTLVYIGFLMASNMTWVHEIIHYGLGHCSGMECAITGLIGISLSAISIYMIR